MGVVWHGRDELLGRDVAVKQVLLPPMASDADARASYRRTLREARTAAKLSHPGVITVFDVIEEDGLPWIVMELIRARPLDQVIAEDGPLPPAQAAQLGLSLLDALTTAHAAGVLHRDVKPSNVLITPEGKAVLTDFGIAAVQGDPGMTQAGMVVGTPGFSPPERVRGAEASAASDLWSLGATLYAAVEGRGPFDRAGGSAAIVASIATEPAPKAPSAGPLAPVIDLLLRSDPAERPDASATARLLSTAWTDARRLGRFGGALLVPPRPRYPAEESGPPSGGTDIPGGPTVAGAAGDATTATQAVTIAAADDTSCATPAQAEGASAAAPAAAAGGHESAAAPAGVGSAIAADTGAATGVVPDLMATPVFAELRMPDQAVSYGEPASDAARAGRVSGQDDAGAGAARPGGPTMRLAGGRIGRLAQSRPGLVLAAPVVVSALIAGVVFLAFPGVGIGHILARIPPGSAPRSGLGKGGLGTTAPAAPSGTKPGNGLSPAGQGPPASPTPSGNRHPGTPISPGRPTAQPSPSPTSGSPQPTPSSSPSPSASPSPSPSPSPVTTGGTLPAGYAWRSVSAQTSGTTAGFLLAAPATWLITPGIQTYLRPTFGGGRLEVNMAAFAAAGPVKEARYLQASAIAHHRYRRYHLVSILAQRFHGWPAASWTFWWKPLNRPRRDVAEIIFTAQTTAGPQPYILSMAAPAAQAAAASHVMRIAMRTFSPLT
jgi:eukaryotic-like serine/threonine-protein kinase